MVLSTQQSILKKTQTVPYRQSTMKVSSSGNQTEEFLILFEKIVSRNKGKKLSEKALNFLLADFGQLYQNEAIRPQVFELLGNLKMELM